MRKGVLCGLVGGVYACTLSAAQLPAAASPLVIQEHSYRLTVDPAAAVVQVAGPGGVELTSLPLTMWAGRRSVVRGSHVVVAMTNDAVEATTLTASGTVEQQASLQASPDWFTVRFSLDTDFNDAPSPEFFYNGARGIDLSRVQLGFSPDTGGAARALPALAVAGRRALTPAPMAVALQTRGAWLGLGIVQVPNATSLRVLPNGAVAVDYSLRQLSASTDSGGGGRFGGAVQFPAFVGTVSPDPLSALSAYHTALVGLGAAPQSTGPQPAWWHLPIVDTWGAQMAEHVARGSAGFTAAWVRQFVGDVRQRYGLADFTVVIDSRWQALIGAPAPDAVRFGGASGMRALIDTLHAEGLRVVLWWPMWARGNAFPPARGGAGIDPTAPGFATTMASVIAELLGSGAGQLDADGLKLDWTYNIPRALHDPSQGTGAAALYRYLQVIHTAAHAVRPDALVEASAASAQFESVSDSVRLYDAWSETAWEARAAVVAAAEPGALIDGDGWDVAPGDAIAHIVTSAVYGVPALYFDSRWSAGAAIPPATARVLGSIAALAASKPLGQALRGASGSWVYSQGGRVLAATLPQDTGLVIWTTVSRAGALVGRLIGTAHGETRIPLPRAGAVTITGPGGVRVAVRVHGTTAIATLQPGTLYTITLR